MLWSLVPNSLFIPRPLKHWSFFAVGLLVIAAGGLEPPPELRIAPHFYRQPKPLILRSTHLSAEQLLVLKSPILPLNLAPLAQSNSVAGGQSCVAMCIDSLTGKKLGDMDVNNKYGFALLTALNSECKEAGFLWKDGGEVGPLSWNLVDAKVNQEKTPVIVALNGPDFSPSGNGNIVVIVATDHDTVKFADPASGTFRTTTKQAINQAPRHPDGNFIFYAQYAQKENGVESCMQIEGLVK